MLLFNQVVAFPSPETLEFFKRVFKNCPIDIDFDSFHVVLNEQKELAALDPSVTYIARAGTLGYWYDDMYQATSLIMPLESDDLLKRMATLRLNYGTLYHPDPLPFMRIIVDMPPLHGDYRRFISSVSTVLYNSQEPLVFTGESQALIALKDETIVPDALYYEDHGLQ